MNIFILARKSQKTLRAFFSAFLIVSMVLSQVALPLAANAQQAKIDICHKDGDSWKFMDTPNQNSLDGHLGHGDFLFDPAWGEGTDEKCIENAPTPVDIVVPTVTVTAKKVICDAEQYLPNWSGLEKTITATTAQEFVDASAGKCKLESNWDFQWGDQNAPDGGPTTIGPVAGYTTFSANTPVVIPLANITQLHLREVLKDGYVPFSNAGDVSAEFYCADDVLNYDNWDFINPVADQTYHCVGFNALSTPPQEPLSCNPQANLIQNGDFEAPAVSSGGYSIVSDITVNPTSVLKWLVKFINPAHLGVVGLEIQNNVAGDPAGGNQHAELDGDHPVTIWQDIPTIAGKEYTLTFKYSPRPGRDSADNTIQPKINGAVLGTAVSADGTANSNTVWQTITRTFMGTGSPVKVELSDAGTDTSFGGYVDDVTLTCGEPLPPPPQCDANASSSIVSDTTTLVDGNPSAVLSYIHPGWTASIPGATWIWSTNPIVGPTNDVDNTEVFTKTFTIVGTPTGGSLQVAADNNYTLKVNGTTVPVAFDQDNFSSVDTYNVLPLLTTGANTLEFTVTNWETGQDANPSANPAGLLYKLSLTNDECVTPPPVVLTSTVTMCKVQPLQNTEATWPLPGWTLMLQGEEVQSNLAIPVNSSAGVNSSTLAAGVSHIAKAVGTWLNQGGANPVDAEYSTTDAWTTQMDGYTGYQSDILELQIDSKFDPNSNWGAYNSLHTYAQSFVPTGTTSNFRIFDGTGTTQNESWFADNSGSLSVKINKGYAGITQGQDTPAPGFGCVEFKNVPYGTYTTGEIMRDGWQNVSGLGQVIVDSPIEKFTIVNETVGTLKINKYVCPMDTVITRTNNGVGGVIPEGCVPQPGATFGYTFDNTKVAPDVTGPYKGLGDGAPFIPMPVTDVNGVSSKTVPSGGRYLVVETGPSGTQLPSSDILGMYCEGDGDTNPSNNDNQEITYVPHEGETKCVAYNKAPVTPPGGSTMVKVHIYKYLKDGETIAQVPNDSTAPAFPMTSSWDAANLGAGSGSYVLGDYHGGATMKYAADTSTMTAPADYTTSETTGGIVVPTNSEICPAGNYRLLGYKSGSALNTAEAAPLSPTAPVFNDITTDQYVIVVNEKCPDVLGETATSDTTVVSPSAMNGWLFFPENTNSGQTGQMVTGPVGQPAGTGSAEFKLTANDQGEVLGMWDLKGTRFDNITSLEYSTFTPTTGVALPALQFEFDNDRTDADNAFRGRLVYEPYFTQTVTTGLWQTWNPMDDAAGTGTGSWWGSPNATSTLDELCPQANPCTWAEVKAAFPNGGLRDNGAFTGATLFKAGSGSIFTSNVDKFVIGIKTGLNTHTETFDFEPNAPEVCAAGSYTDSSDNSGAIRFENSQGYNTGSINGVNGWSATGAYDYGVVANTYGYASFNDQAFRISNGITSGSFGDWAFATPNTNGAGESGATAGSFSIGTLQNHFEAQFDIASTRPCAVQEGLKFSVSPDRGDGSRMSYLRFEDGAAGLNAFFVGVSGTDDASISFDETQVATGLDRSIPHKVKFVMDFVEGASNDVVKIYIDGVLVHTGTSWENYYRYDNEASAEQTPRIVKTLIFQARGTAVPANTGKGYLVDNLTLGSSTIPTTPTPTITGGGGGGGGGSAPLGKSAIGPATTGSVLGASTGCGIYLDDFLKMGWKNRSEQVKKLQTFLNDYLKLSPKLPVTGMFGMQTYKAVVQFQQQEADLVLQPWVGVTLKDAKKGTGFVYKTTITRINNIMCPELNIATPAAVID